MTFGEALASVWARWATFSGRARRDELLYWVLALAAVGCLTYLAVTGSRPFLPFAGALVLVFYLAAFWPSLAVGVRRLHDSGRSGGWLLLLLVPAAGHLLLLILLMWPGSLGANQYGPSPIQG